MVTRLLGAWVWLFALSGCFKSHALLVAHNYTGRYERSWPSLIEDDLKNLGFRIAEAGTSLSLLPVYPSWGQPSPNPLTCSFQGFAVGRRVSTIQATRTG